MAEESEFKECPVCQGRSNERFAGGVALCELCKGIGYISKGKDIDVILPPYDDSLDSEIKETTKKRGRPKKK